MGVYTVCGCIFAARQDYKLDKLNIYEDRIRPRKNRIFIKRDGIKFT